MNIDTTSPDTLVVRLALWEMIASAHPGSFRIPKDLVERAHLEVPHHGWKRLRVPGGYLPGVFQTGTYLWGERREFWFTHRWHASRVVIELKQYSRYDRLVLGVANAEAEAQRINDWVGAGGSSNG